MGTNRKSGKGDRKIADRADEYRRKVYVQPGEVVCKDCLADLEVTPDDADPTKTYDYTSNNVTRVV